MAHRTTLTADEITLLGQWHQRVVRYRAGDAQAMPEGVAGLNSLKVMGASGDQSVAFPRVQRAALQTLPADVQFAVNLVERTVAAQRRTGAGRMTMILARDGTNLDEPVFFDEFYKIDPYRDTEIIIVAPIAGG